MNWRHVKAYLLLVIATLSLLSCNPARSKTKNAFRKVERKPQPATLRLSERIRLVTAARAVTELDVQAAQRLLSDLVSHDPIVPFLRARLALALGDCEGATSLLTNGTHLSSNEVETLRVAEGCARAMAGAEVVVDEARGVWVRIQNSRDRVLVPLIAEVADRARFVIGQHLHVELPRPLRIELVSDLISLSYLTGLPLEAAETTGTVAIARWGKVTMLSPRATREGYPWQDTLAHEIAHLTVTRQSGDEAPLWLQEGIAKREETAWRSPRLLDDSHSARRLARRALLEGRSVGIERLGASIALQPTPQAAATAYAEVQSFHEFLIGQIGEAALRLFLFDLRGLGGIASNSAMRSVTGYDLDEWIVRWRSDLSKDAASPNDEPTIPQSEVPSLRDGNLDTLRRLRLGVLLSGRRHWASAAEQLALVHPEGALTPEVRWRRALAESKLGRWQLAADAIAKAETLPHLDGTWLAGYGRIMQQSGQLPAAEQAFELSLSFAPTLERVACRGAVRSDQADVVGVAILPTLEPFRSLCLDALGTDVP